MWWKVYGIHFIKFNRKSIFIRQFLEMAFACAQDSCSCFSETSVASDFKQVYSEAWKLKCYVQNSSGKPIFTQSYPFFPNPITYAEVFDWVYDCSQVLRIAVCIGCFGCAVIVMSYFATCLICVAVGVFIVAEWCYMYFIVPVWAFALPLDLIDLPYGSRFTWHSFAWLEIN